MPQNCTAADSYTLSFTQLEREIPALATETIYESARHNGVRIIGACGGRGTCGSCVVRIVAGEVERSQNHPEGDGPDENGVGGEKKKWVRACMARARSDCTIEMAPRSLAPVVRAEVGGREGEDALVCEPAIVSLDISVPEATMTDNICDLERVMRAVAEPVTTLDFTAARQLPKLLRDGRWALRAFLRGQELIGFAPTGSPTLGLAVDLGTTNAAAFLIDLEKGVRLASLGIENPQVAWGADLINRINHATTPEGAEEMRAAALTAINALAHDVCHAVGAKTGDIVDVVVCGNTAMQHLLLALPVVQLGRAPFVAAVRDGMDIKARDVGLTSICPGAYVHIAPSVGGFVGGDHVTALLATEPHWRGIATSIVMDIGTNTEITLIHQGRFYSASTPSGPALEGGHIACGMRAADGAIERLSVDDDGKIAIKVIGHQKPIGLCGSGVLDAVAALGKSGMMETRGRLVAAHPNVIQVGNQRAAVLAPGVHFTQDDVRAVQLAKSAIRTGVDLLLREAQIEELDIQRFIIAGAFGAYINLESGIAVGLFPDLPRERFLQVGNAAGVGVRQMLASQTARRRAQELAAGCRYVELSNYPDFQKTFLRHVAGFTPTPPPRKA